MPTARTLLTLVLAFMALILLRRILSRFRGGASMEDLMALKAAGAQIVDVRTEGEYAQGHPPRSTNIPLDQIQARLAEIDPARPVLLCCASGGRSGMAKQILERAGYRDVHNAGPWTRLQ